MFRSACLVAVAVLSLACLQWELVVRTARNAMIGRKEDGLVGRMEHRERPIILKAGKNMIATGLRELRGALRVIPMTVVGWFVLLCVGSRF